MFNYLDLCGEVNISGWDLYDWISSTHGTQTYPSTLIKYAKEYADISGASFICVDRARSVYHFVPGFKIESAIIQGLE
jgi:hypothetical protein